MEGHGNLFEPERTYSDEAWAVRTARFSRRVGRVVLGTYSALALAVFAASAFFGVPEPALASAAVGSLCALLWREIRTRRVLDALAKEAVIARLKE